VSDAKETGLPEVVEDARAFFDYVNAYDDENRREALDDKQFLRGDQWLATDRQLREVEQRPCLTINVLPSFIQQVVNDQRQNKTNIKTHPVENADDKLNEIAQGLIKHIEYSSNADVAYDRALGSATEVGFGYWRLITDYCDDKSFDQEIKYTSIRNAFSVYFDPNSVEPDGSDQKRCLIAVDVPRKDFEKQYPDASILGAEFISSTGNNQSQWATDQSIRVGEFYRIEETDEILYRVGNGASAFGDELKKLGMTESDLKGLTSRKSKRRKVMLYKITGAEVLESTEIKCRWIPVFPVWGTEIDINGKVYRQGMIRAAKDPAKMYNVLMSAATEEVASRSKAPWIGAEGQFEGHEKKWRQANRRAFPYLEYKPKTVEGTLAPPPQRQAMTDVPTGFLTMAGHARDDIKATTGIFDASLGAQGNETSGKAINARKRQGDVANFHYADNLVRTQRHCGRCILDMIPNYYDATRIVRIMGDEGDISTAQINQPSLNQNGAEILLNDMTAPRYDLTVESGPAYSTQRAEATDAMVQLAQGNPQIMQVAGDLIVKGMDFKGADQIAERLKMALPPPIQQALENSDESPEVAAVKAQAQQVIDQANQQIQAAEQGIAQRDEALRKMQDELLKRQEEHEAKMAEIQVKAYDAEKKRITAMAPAVDPQLLMQVAQQVAVSALQSVMPQPEIGMPMKAQEYPPQQMPQQMQQEPPPGGFFSPDELPTQ